MSQGGWACYQSLPAVDAPDTGSNAGSNTLAARMNKPDGGDFAHISRFPLQTESGDESSPTVAQ
jgi:hypothetical protein